MERNMESSRLLFVIGFAVTAFAFSYSFEEHPVMWWTFMSTYCTISMLVLFADGRFLRNAAIVYSIGAVTLVQFFGEDVLKVLAVLWITMLSHSLVAQYRVRNTRGRTA